MQTQLADFIKVTPDGAEAASILGKCVHCGFCTATCPTYQLLGDELDGPRGRIYLIKQVLEGVKPTEATQLHLDRCLTCRSCETTCPSGVQYGRLLDIGRRVVEEQVGRPAGEAIKRAALRSGLTGPFFAPALKLGRMVRPLLPASLADKIPTRHGAGAWPMRSHPRRMLLLAGCVQPAMMPNINAATARVLDALGIQTIVPPEAGCCGALRHHLNDGDTALEQARRNIDAWWPHVQAGAEAIVMNVTGCAAHVVEYGYLLRSDPAYAQKSARIADLTKDLSEILPDLLAALPPLKRRGVRVAFHPPCTLQHGLKVRGVVEAALASLGCEVLPFAEMHLCCGAAGTYSILQPELSERLRERKLAHLTTVEPEVILSANIGCIAHLQTGTKVPVMHWIEWLDANLAAA